MKNNRQRSQIKKRFAVLVKKSNYFQYVGMCMKKNKQVYLFVTITINGSLMYIHYEIDYGLTKSTECAQFCHCQACTNIMYIYQNEYSVTIQMLSHIKFSFLFFCLKKVCCGFTVVFQQYNENSAIRSMYSSIVKIV